MTGEFLKNIRLYQGLTVEIFALKYAVSESTIHAAETGRRNVSPTLEARILKDFDVMDSDFIEFLERRDFVK